jgi:hypothetical protein
LDDEKMLPLSPYRVECDYFSADLADSAAADRTLSFWLRSTLIWFVDDQAAAFIARIARRATAIDAPLAPVG